MLTSLEGKNTFEKMVGMVTVMKMMMIAPRQQLWKSRARSRARRRVYRRGLPLKSVP